MVLKTFVRVILKSIKRLESWSEDSNKIDEKEDTAARLEEQEVQTLHSVWDHLNMQENSQAFHLCSVIGFEEWVDMGEIRRRIKEIFNMEYSNERSLYPYLKTLVDLGLMETTDIGGRRKWRKRDLIIKIKRKKRVDSEGEELVSEAR